MKGLAVARQASALSTVDERRLEAQLTMDPDRKSEYGQYMTPGRVAQFMAALFTTPQGEIRLLDPGAGVGSLSAAFLGVWGRGSVEVCAYEIDPMLAVYLGKTLANTKAEILRRDFIEDAVYQLKLGTPRRYTHAILNPPYKKISSDSLHRSLLRAVGLETVNLYSAFVGLALELMANGGELVAIIPRSFCNGPYYKPFREWILAKASLEHIHLFHSRTSAFHDDDVLQENVIIKLLKGVRQGPVTITTATNSSFVDLCAHAYPFQEIVHNKDPQRFIHIPVDPRQTCVEEELPLATRSLEEIALEVSTGPVVDFRLKEFLRQDPEVGTVPLLYPVHFTDGSLKWPRQTKKPNAIVLSQETQRWLYPIGFYTVVKRFSSKEERRRLVAHVVSPESFPNEQIGFENHLNVFHSRKSGIDKDLAYGLAVFLNSTAVDDCFRRFSGHTQVNATDLRLLRYPDQTQLALLGRWAQTQKYLTQTQIDDQVNQHAGRR